MPNYSHGAVQANIIGIFYAQAGAKYRISSELSLEFDEKTVVIPDISVLPRRAADWGGEPVRCKEVPILAVEILSPTQGDLELHLKRNAYFARGVESVWIVEPDLQAVAIYRPGEQRPQIIQQGEAKDPATGLVARLEEVFA